MNVLDENIIYSQRRRLRQWKIHVRCIGEDLGWSGMKDKNDIIPLLQSLKNPTFFTGDSDFYRIGLLHSAYCLAYLEVTPEETAEYVRRFLRHREFRTQKQRMGRIVCIGREGLRFRQTGDLREHRRHWQEIPHRLQ
jgi:hypothetical protein